jgi:hypothetical protein
LSAPSANVITENAISSPEGASPPGTPASAPRSPSPVSSFFFRCKPARLGQGNRFEGAGVHKAISNTTCPGDWLTKTKRSSFERLRIKSIQQNRTLAKALLDISWYSLRTKIAYKAAMAGRHIVAIDQ